MTQEENEILLNDLGARLPYEVKISIPELWTNEEKVETLNEIFKGDDDLYRVNSKGVLIKYIKPYLFPLSSMTDELWDKEFRGCCIPESTRDSFKYGIERLELDNGSTDFSNIVKFISQLIKHHFDIYGLIPMGLGIDATGLNIY